MDRARRLTAWVVTLCVLAGSRCQTRHRVEVVSFESPELEGELAALSEALDGVQIVLLGENGHGVGEFTRAKVELVEWLHGEHGFEVVVFESGFFECGRAWRGRGGSTPRQALRACLRYPFEHSELLPLFARIGELGDSRRPLELAGMDLQAQGFDSGDRPETTAGWLTARDPELARRVARADSAVFLVPGAGGLGDGLYRFARENATALKWDYRAAARLSEGHRRWAFLLAEAWVERLALRGRAEAEGRERPPARYYELRDEWMARTLSALADSMGRPRKVVAWLHNDHARYGRFPISSDSIRSTGGFLREWYGDEVLSVGFFLGRGTVTDNARRPRTVAPVPAEGVESFLARGPATYLVLRGNGDPAVRAWADSPQPYLRGGLDTLRLVPAREFDALVYIDSVGVPGWVR